MMFERTISSVWLMPKVTGGTAASFDFHKLKPVQLIMIFFVWKIWSVMIGKIVFN